MKKRVMRVIFPLLCLTFTSFFLVLYICLKREEESKLPARDKLNVSSHVAMEILDVTETYVKIKFSNTSQNDYYLDAMWVEYCEDDVWREICYKKPSDVYTYRIAPDTEWSERGLGEDVRVNVLTEPGDTWEIKTLQEDCTNLEKGQYRIGYIVADRKNELEVISGEFQVN